MSNALKFGMLGILMVLLGIMSFTVRKYSEKEAPPQPTPEQAQQMRKQQQEMMKRDMEQRKKMMEQMKQAQQTAKQQAASKKVNPTAPPMPAQLDISEDWFKRRQAGMNGLKQLEARDKQQPATAPSQPTLAKPGAPASSSHMTEPADK